MSVALTLHLLAVIIWIGGMFFAHMALRPAVNQLLQPPQRLPLMLKVFDGFFPWVWAAIILILVSGFWMLFTLYQNRLSLSLWIMAIIGSLMVLIFIYIYTVPYRRMTESVPARELPTAAAAMAMIRRLIGINLILGLGVSILAVVGKYGGI